MQLINIQEVKADFSQILAKALAGENIVIAQAGKPVAKLIAYNDNHKPRKQGIWKNKVILSEDFDNEDKEVNCLFYGNK
jgi:prevent-host-death family protein